jgi:sigma-B regulation protein RsbU (phosphoserine phosphatase)
MDGRLILSAGRALDDASVASVAEIRCGPGKAALGRVVGRGDEPIVGAVVESLAASLAALASTTHEHAPGGAAAHRLEAELALSRRIQRSLIPLAAPKLRGFEVASHYEAAREVGGDFFDVFPLRDRAGRAGIVIADVTGKGIAAALLMAFSRPLLHAAIDHTTTPADALDRTNTILVGERRTSLFITALCARLDLPTGRLQLANAGHEPPLHIPADGGPPSLVLGSGTLLGAFPDIDVPPVEWWLGPGDTALFYTDGVTDAQSPSGERFDEGGLLAAVERARGGSARELIDGISVALERFVAGADPADDITMVALRRSPGR